ncbi:phage GP46 family protein [Microvirga solisilvae]|uniref:phage GP46 family protein n=1 Tax=Microvirga solisilvae TaxID=2919498 RepID=UPI001FAEA2D5|nr:phage GP46 family protein [Microvirga solisilvae]
MDMRVRIAEGQDEQPLLLWDTVWDPVEGRADWALADPSEKHNAGGLRALTALETSVILCLFTDKRCPESHPLRWLAGDDLRGWWGDGIDVRTDLGETEMGSLLWLLETAPLRMDNGPVNIPLWAETFAVEALQPLVNQGAVVRVEAVATPRPEAARLDLDIKLFGRDQQQIYERRFEAVWKQRQ